MITINGRPVTTMVFSGGEVNPRLPEGLTSGRMEIVARLQSSDDILNLLMVKDALVRHYGSGMKVHLTVPYFPYARQDRVCSSGEALGLEAMAELLKDFGVITVYDLHNPDAAPSNLRNVELLDIIRQIAPTYTDNTILVSPDKGATAKVKAMARYYDLDWIQGEKLRDPKSGVLSGFDFTTDLNCEGKELIIVDDICDGGGTFLGLGSLLKKQLNPKSLSLYVTHGIFSRGFTALNEVFDHIYTTDTFEKDWMPSDKLTVYKVV